MEILYFTGMGVRSFWEAIQHYLFSWNTVDLQILLASGVQYSDLILVIKKWLSFLEAYFIHSSLHLLIPYRFDIIF